MTTFIAFEPEQFRELLDALRAPLPAPPAEPAPERGPDVEPWTFYSPHAKCEVTTYLDERAAPRYVSLADVADVPKHWRRVYVAVSG